MRCAEGSNGATLEGVWFYTCKALQRQAREQTGANGGSGAGGAALTDVNSVPSILSYGVGAAERRRSASLTFRRVYLVKQCLALAVVFINLCSPQLTCGETTVEALVAPDTLFLGVSHLFEQAEEEILVAGYTFSNLELGFLLASQAERGVDVILLLEGHPFAGMYDQERWLCQRLESAGVQIFFTVGGDQYSSGVNHRLMHAKYSVVDGRIIFVSSENWTQIGMPEPVDSERVFGNRGTGLILFDTRSAGDLRQLYYSDLVSDEDDLVYSYSIGDPAMALEWDLFLPSQLIQPLNRDRFVSLPQQYSDVTASQIIVSPQDAAVPGRGLLGLLEGCAEGDQILVEQAYELLMWYGWSSSLPGLTNPRLMLYLEAARHGGQVRILLDDPDCLRNRWMGNCRTAERLNSIGTSTLECRIGRPTGGRIHNKMILVRRAGRCFVHIGSINGSENSSCVNREVALQLESTGLFNFYSDMFFHDWRQSMPYRDEARK